MTRRDALAATVALAAAARAAPACAQSDAMKALIAAAQAEGSVTIDGPPVDTARKFLTEDFQRAYGIPVTYISSSGSAASGARVRAERAAGKYLLDVFISGSDTPTLTFLPGGWLDRVEPILVAPDVIDKRKWQDGHLWYIDPQNTILRVLKNVVPEIAINTKYVKRGEIPTWKTLLDPKWQGKYVAKDPASLRRRGIPGELLLHQLRPRFRQEVLPGSEARALARSAARSAMARAGQLSGRGRGRPGRDHALPATRLSGRSDFSDRCSERAHRQLGTRVPHEQSAAPERREAVHQLARRPPGGGDLRQIDAVVEPAHRREIRRSPAAAFFRRRGRYMDTYEYEFVTRSATRR